MQHMKSVTPDAPGASLNTPCPYYQQLVRDVVWQHHAFKHRVLCLLRWQIKLGWGHLPFILEEAAGQGKTPSISMLKCSSLLQMEQKWPETLGKALSLQWDVTWEFSGWGDVSTLHFPLLKDVSLWKDSEPCEDRIHFISNYSLAVFLKGR